MFLHTSSFDNNVKYDEDLDLVNLLNFTRGRDSLFDDVIDKVQYSKLVSNRKRSSRNPNSCQIPDEKVIDIYQKSRNKTKDNLHDIASPNLSPTQKISFKEVSPCKFRTNSNVLSKVQFKSKSTASNTKVLDKTKDISRFEEEDAKISHQKIKEQISEVSKNFLASYCEGLETLENAHAFKHELRQAPKEKKGFFESIIEFVNPFNCN